jgi:CMP-N,N'-diacetyllegionaminic acid synthase
VVVSTDSDQYADISRYYGAQVPFLRPPGFAGDLSPDIEWVEYTLKRLRDDGKAYDCFSILRPTCPFRQAETIQRACKAFFQEQGVDSLRAVEKCKQHPGKMWVVRDRRMFPLLPLSPSDRPWHSSQYQSLPEVYVQNASLEIAWSYVVFEYGTIAGNMVMPFFTKGNEGFDINDKNDWILACELVNSGKVDLMTINRKPYPLKGSK